MLVSLILVLNLSGPVAAPVHAQSASAMPVGAVVRDRSAVEPGTTVREVCYRGKPTGSNVTQNLCRMVPVATPAKSSNRH